MTCDQVVLCLTGSFLYTYINAVHPLVVKEDGRSMFDAYLVAVASGPTPIHQCAAAIPAGDERRFIRNAGVPVVRVMSQSDYLSGIAARRRHRIDDRHVPLRIELDADVALVFDRAHDLRAQRAAPRLEGDLASQLFALSAGVDAGTSQNAVPVAGDRFAEYRPSTGATHLPPMKLS